MSIPALKTLKLHNGRRPIAIGIQMNLKEPTKTFMMIPN